MSKYLLASLNSFFIILFAYFAFLSITSWQESIELTGEIDISIGSYLYLPLGAYAFCWVVFGKQGFPGQLLISILMSLYWELESSIFVQFALINVLGPVVAIAIFRVLEVYKFKDFKSETSMAILFLCIVLALINTLFKFLVYFMSDDQSSNAYEFLATYLQGDVIGSFVFIVFAKFVMGIFHLGNYHKKI